MSSEKYCQRSNCRSPNGSVNPYFVFLCEFRKNLKKRGVLNLKPTSVAKIAGRKWREMTPAQKWVYIETAKTNKAKIKASKYRKTEEAKQCCFKKEQHFREKGLNKKSNLSLVVPV
ncbi:uncharacterized protein [Drosophila kikkawai]|uniref:HMG box domain-containing protein n=1 Tax=Drosophila kikkawai TaxID=30033 RepID=A0ABM3C7T2_DROKI|nr:DNA-binding protein MNB1B [Drosophila kikkawai]